MMNHNQTAKLENSILSILLILFLAVPLFASDTVELSGTVYYNHAPITNVTTVVPELWVSDTATNQVVENATFTYNNATAAYTIGNLPLSTLSMTLNFHITGSEYTLPGNYRSYDNPDLTQMSDLERANYSITARGIIHQTSPWDNSRIDFAMPPTDPYPVHPRQLEFRWDPVPGAVQYWLIIYKYKDPDHPDGPGFIDDILYTATEETSYTIEMEDSQPHEHYESMIVADNPPGEYIASFAVTFTNGYGGLYPFKIDGFELILKQVKIKAGKTEGSDSFTITGWLDSVQPDDFVNGDAVTLWLGELNPFVIDQSLKQSGKKAKYSYKGTPSLKLDLESGLFKVSAKNVDLSGLSAPVQIGLEFGDYAAWTNALDEGSEDIINGKKMISLEFLSGYADALRIDSLQIKTNDQPQGDSLSIQGAIAVVDTEDTPANGLNLLWQDQTFSVPADEIIIKNSAYSFKKVLTAQGAVLSGSIDMAKCRFKITLKSADLNTTSGPVICGLSFDGFYKTVYYTLP